MKSLSSALENTAIAEKRDTGEYQLWWVNPPSREFSVPQERTVFARTLDGAIAAARRQGFGGFRVAVVRELEHTCHRCGDRLRPGWENMDHSPTLCEECEKEGR